MTAATLAARARQIAGWSAAALGLAIPISTAADGILLGLVLLAAIVGFAASLPAMRSFAVHTPPASAALLLFGLLAIGCLYGIAPRAEALSGLSKYLELALIPMLMWAASDAKVRRRALILFAVAVVLNLYVSYSAAAGLPGLRRPHYPIGFKASVTHSLIVAFGAFLFLLWAREARRAAARAAVIALALVCAHNVLFVVIGRTGYVVLGLLLIYYLVTTLRGWRGPVVAALAVISIAGGAYTAADSLRQRVDEIGSDIAQWRPGARDDTSVGQRLEYYRLSLSIVADHPIAGVGTGGFARAYAQKVGGTASRVTENPHNDYLMIAVQTGVPGLVLLLALYAVTWRCAARLDNRLERDLARGLVIVMAVGGLFNSLLMDHTEGLLFAWLIAVLFAGYNRAVPGART